MADIYEQYSLSGMWSTANNSRADGWMTGGSGPDPDYLIYNSNQSTQLNQNQQQIMIILKAFNPFDAHCCHMDTAIGARPG